MVRIGIIGSGFGVIGLAPAFRGIPGCSVVAVSERRSEWRDFLTRSDIDAVAIAVPPHAQFEIAKAAILKGLHVFAEKPLAANTRDARQLLRLAEERGITHGIDFLFPEIPSWKQAKKMLDKELFGKLEHISVHWAWLSNDIKHGLSSWKTSIKEGGGLLSFYLSHSLQYLEHFGGPIAGVQSAFAHSPKSAGGGEVGIDMLLKFKRGAIGHISASCMHRGRIVHELIFQCERGVITLATKNAVVDGFVLKTYSDSGEKTVRVKSEKARGSEDERVKIVRTLAKRFVAACRSNKQMTPSFKEGVRVQELIDMARRGRVF